MKWPECANLQEIMKLDDKWQPEVEKWLEVYLREHDCFWDIGCAVGSVSVIARRYTDGPIVLVDALPNLLASAVTKISEPVWASCALIRDVSGPHTFDAGDCFLQLKNRYVFPALTLDELSQFVPLPDVLKLDLEGGDGLALRAADQVLKHVHTLIIESIPELQQQHGITTKEVDELLKRKGFTRIDKRLMNELWQKP